MGYVYQGTPAHLQPTKSTKTPTSNSSSAPSTPPPQANAGFFMSANIRMDILHKNSLTLSQPDPAQFPDLPPEVDNYHELCPLEPIHKPASTVLGYQTSTYKATSLKNGNRYCLRRIHGEYFIFIPKISWQNFFIPTYEWRMNFFFKDFRLGNTKCMVLVDMWKRICHTNVVQLLEVFTTKAFGDHCMYKNHFYFL